MPRCYRERRAIRAGRERTTACFLRLWLVRTGSPWRDLPEAFGCWNTAFRRFRRWACKGVFEGLLAVLSSDPDFEYALVDGIIVRVHQHGTGAKGGLALRPSAARAVA